MILIPELEKIVLMPPKTASTALSNALLAEYPEAFRLYRHGEGNLVPFGYDSWEKVGLVRDPFDRLYSLFQYLKNFDHGSCAIYAKRMRDSVEGLGFSDWVLGNADVFSYGYSGQSLATAKYMTSAMLPETKKPQTMTLRPDLGTTVWAFEDIEEFAKMLGIDWLAKELKKAPPVSAAAKEHIHYYHASDFAVRGKL